MSKIVTLSLAVVASLFANIYSNTYVSMYYSNPSNGSSGFANTQRFSVGTNPETGEKLYNISYASDRRLNPNAYYLFDLYHVYENNFRVFLPNYAWGFGYVFNSYRSVGLYNVIASMSQPSTSTANAVDATQDANLAEDYTPENPEWYADSRSMFEILDSGQNIHYYNRSMLFLEGTYLPKSVSENLNRWVYFATAPNTNGSDSVQYVGMNIYVHLYPELVDNYVNTHNLDYDEAYCNRSDIYSGDAEEIAQLKNACIYITSFGDDGYDNDWSTHSNTYRYMAEFGDGVPATTSEELPDGCFKYFINPSNIPILCSYEEPLDGKYCENNESGSYCETDDLEAYILSNSETATSSVSTLSSSSSTTSLSSSSSSVYVDPEIQDVRDILLTKQYTGYEIKGEYRNIGSGQFDWVYRDLSTAAEFKLTGCSVENGFSLQWSLRTRGVLPGPNQTQTNGDITTPIIIPNQTASSLASSESYNASSFASSIGYYSGTADGLYIQIGASASDWVYVDANTNYAYKLDGCNESGGIKWMTISEGNDSFTVSVVGDRIYFSE